MPDWDDLSDDELEQRLVRRGMNADRARHLVDERDDEVAVARITAALA